MVDVIGTVGFALHIAHRVYELVESIKDAPEEIKALRVEVSRVRSFLPDLLDALQSDYQGPGAWREDQLQTLHMEAEHLMKAAETFIEKATKTKADGTQEVHKIKWLLNASRSKKLAEEFRGFYLSITAVYSIRTSCTVTATFSKIHEWDKYLLVLAQQAPGSSAQPNKLFAARCMVENKVRAAADDQRNGRSQIFDQVSASDNLVLSSFTIVSSSNHPALHTTQSISTPDIRGSSTAPMGTSPMPSFDVARCPAGCRCRCHRPAVPVIPQALSSWFGSLYAPRTLLSSLWSSRTLCDGPSCMRRHSDLLTIKYYLPSWSADVNADIRFKSLPVHFYIRTPRVVKSLGWLMVASVEDVQRKLSSRQLTVNDVMPDGFTVTHVVMVRLTFDMSETASSILALLADHSAPDEELWDGLTPLEQGLRWIQMEWRRYGSRNGAIDAFKSQIAGTSFYQETDDAWQGLADKMQWTDLHRRIAALPSPSSSNSTTSIDSIPLAALAAQVNVEDALGWTPLYYAASEGPETVALLLQAGADPWIDRGIVCTAAHAGADAVVSLLVRAGADVNACDSNGYTALHWAAHPDTMLTPAGLAFAQAIVRHAGHALDWDMQDKDGDTPLDWAKLRVDRNPSDEDSKRIFELYRTRRVPEGAQYVQPGRIAAASEDKHAPGFPATSLIGAGLRGDFEAIGDLICRDAMVNERDALGHTLLHLVAWGQVPNGFRVALELVRHGGYGVDWDARSNTGNTALKLVEWHLAKGGLDREAREEAENVRRLLLSRRLPPGERYIFPCMDPDFRIEQLIPGSWPGN